MQAQALPTKTEAALLLAAGALAAVAAFAPAVPTAPVMQVFADQRNFFGLIGAVDVLSCAAFGIAGLAGLWMLWRAPARAVGNVQRAMSLMFFGGLVLLALGTASLYLDPRDATLAGARLCVVVALAGLLGLVAAERVSDRAGALLGLGVLGLGMASVQAWQASGNLLPWLVLQAGSVLALWWLATLRRRERALGVDAVLILLACGAARLLDLNDAAIFEATGRLVSGHTLEHVVAALAVWPVLTALADAGQQRAARPLPIASDVAIRWWRDA